MAKGSAWSIKVDTKLDTSTIQQQLNEVSAKLKPVGLKINVNEKAAGQIADTQKSTDALGKSAKSTMLTFQAANMVFNDCVKAISAMTSQVMEMDDALVQMRKVSDLSGASLDAYVDKLSTYTGQVARTTSELLDAATQFKKSGFTEDEAADLAVVASMFQNVADTEISAEDAAASLVSQIRAFGFEAEDAMHIVDAYNSVANNFSVGTNDIATGMETAGAAMKSYGNEFEQIVGMVAAGAEILQGRPAMVARGLSTIAGRLVKNADALEAYGIAVENTDGTLRSTYDILSDLSVEWEKMSEVERVTLGQTIAGTNQYKVLSSVMSNFQTAIDATTTAQNSAGSAAKENAAAVDSLQGRVTALSAAFQDMGRAVVDSDLVKSLLSITTSIVKLGSTDIGSFVTQVTLLSGLTWGGLNKLSVSILPSIMKSFGASTVAIEGFQAAIAGALPYIAATVAIVGTLIKIVDVLHVSYEEQVAKVEQLTEAYEEMFGMDSQYQYLIDNEERLTEVEKDRLEVLRLIKEEQEATLKVEKQKEYEKYSTSAYGKEEAWSDRIIYQGVLAGDAQITMEQYATNLAKISSEYADIYQTLIEYKDAGMELSEQDEKFINDYEVLAKKINKLKNSEAERIKQMLILQGMEEWQAEASKEYQDALGKELTAMNKTTSATKSYSDAQLGAIKNTLGLLDAVNQMSIMAGSSEEYDAAFQGYAKAFKTLNDEFEAGRIGSKALDDSLKILVSDTVYNAIQGTSDYDTKLQMLQTTITNLTPLFGDAESAGQGLIEALNYTQTEGFSGSIQDIADKFDITTGAALSLIEALRVMGYNVELSTDGVINDFETMGFVIGKTADGITEIDWDAYAEMLSGQGVDASTIQNLYNYLDQIQGIDLVTLNEQEQSVAESAGDAATEADSLNDVTYDTAISNLSELKDAFDAVRDSAENAKTAAAALGVSTSQTTSSTKIEEEATGTTNAKGGKTLVNEEGPEIIQSGDKAYIAGDGLPTVTDLKPGDMVFNAEDTKDIMKRSGVSGLTGGIGSMKSGNVILIDGKYVDPTAYSAAQSRGKNVTLIDGKYVSLPTASIQKVKSTDNSNTFGISGGGSYAAADTTSVGSGSGTSSSSASSEDAWKKEFEAWLKAKKHALAMDEITEEQYYNELEKMYKKYFSDKTKYQEEYWEYEEQVYEYRKKQQEDEEERLQKQLDIEEKLNDLAKAQAAKQYVYSGGQFGYASDVDAVAAAQAALRETRGYASGTTSAFGGMSLVGENGPELRVLNDGDGIVPSNMTRNLMALGSLGVKGVVDGIKSGVGSAYSFAIDNLSLPNVKNASEFFDGLKAYAMQYQTKRA